MALVLAIPAYALTNGSFAPLEQRARIEGHDVGWAFDLAAPEPIFLEFEFTVRGEGPSRPPVVLVVNGTAVATLDPEVLYVARRAMVLVPADVVRAGTNRLRVRVNGPAAATVALSLRLHNYYGISPRFPRAVVVSDLAVDHRARQQPELVRAATFAGYFAASVVLVWLIARGAGRRGGARLALMLSPSAILWAAVLYSWATPLHIWLSYEALATLVLVPYLLTAGVLWAVAHRRVVVRVAWVTVATLVLLEIALRAFNVASPSPLFYVDSYGRYRGQPGAPHFDTRLNSRGFNDVEVDATKPPGVFRIAAIGDSVAFGVVPYAANYLTLLERELADAGRGAVDVINLGVPGTEPRDYLAILVDEGLPLAPDLVLVNFFIGNDFEASTRKWSDRSYVATAVNFVWQLWTGGGQSLARYGAAGATYRDDEPTLPPDRFLEIAVDRAHIYAEDDADLRPALARAVGYLQEMRDLARRADARFVVVVIPDEVQIDPALQEQVARARGLGVDQLDLERPNRLLAHALSREGIQTLDLLPAFAEQARREPLYKPRDTHWNLAGNRLAAAQIAAFLKPMMN